jgi:hypothetical protein
MPGAAIAEGAIGGAPPGWLNEREMRPMCHSCRNTKPPLAWIAWTMPFQPSTCSGVWMPGVLPAPPPGITCEASAMIRPPALARCA